MTPPAAPATGPAGGRLAAGALSLLLGAGLQLRQPALWPVEAYGALLAAALALLALAAWGRRRRVAGAALTAAVLVLAGSAGLAGLAFAATGLRAQARLADRLPSALEGRDLVVTGVVAQMPRVLPDGVRFVFEPEQALLEGRPVALPRRLSLGWYRGWRDEPAVLLAPYDGLAAGQRWRFGVRLKRPHGSLNPHGFDHELWMFEQGLLATGYVRATERSAAELLDDGVGAPVERARQRVRDAIGARVADPRAAGVLAALAVGDQAAIECSLAKVI
jgi:competence protein ComEC